MSELWVTNVYNQQGDGAPNFPNGATVTGVVTATTFKGGAEISSGIITATSATFSGAVSIGGTLTYEDVTNIDSVGVITARGGIVATGVVTATSFAGSNVTITSDESDEVSNSSIIFKTDGTEKVRIGNSAGHGCVGISTGVIDPDGNKLLIRGASTIGTNKGHIMLTGDGSTVGEGPQIVFSESGPGANWAGAYIGHTRQGSGSLGDLRFGTRATGGNANTVPTERLRISSDGAIGIGGANYGTSGQVLTSGGASAAPSWVDASGGAWEYVSTIANPNTSTVQFTGFTTAYLAYKVYFFGVAVNTSNDRPFRAQVFLNSSLKTSGYRYYGPYGDDSGSGTTKQRSDNGDSGVWFSGKSNRGNCAYSGEIYFPMNRVMSGNGGYKCWYARCMSNYTNMIGGGTHDDSQNTQVTGVSFDSPDPYNITNGEFFLYRMLRPV